MTGRISRASSASAGLSFKLSLRFPGLGNEAGVAVQANDWTDFASAQGGHHQHQLDCCLSNSLSDSPACDTKQEQQFKRMTGRISRARRASIISISWIVFQTLSPIPWLVNDGMRSSSTEWHCVSEFRVVGVSCFVLAEGTTIVQKVGP